MGQDVADLKYSCYAKWNANKNHGKNKVNCHLIKSIINVNSVIKFNCSTSRCPKSHST